jgi:hypothetical protein
LAAPIYANLTGLAPLLIQVGAAETLLDDAIRLAKVAGAADVRVGCGNPASRIASIAATTSPPPALSPKNPIAGSEIEMHSLRLALAGVFAITMPIAATASGPGSNMRQSTQGRASNIVLMWDGSGSGGPLRSYYRPPLSGSRRMEWTRGSSSLGAKSLL